MLSIKELCEWKNNCWFLCTSDTWKEKWLWVSMNDEYKVQLGHKTILTINIDEAIHLYNEW